MIWESMSAEDMQQVFKILHRRLADMKIEREIDVQTRVRAFVMSEFGEQGDAPWATWFPVVASMYLYMSHDGQLFGFDYVVSTARVSTGRPVPPGAPAFPGPDEDRCWSGWGEPLGTPPPIKRAGQPVISPHAGAWEQPEYDVWQWDVMYDLLTRLKHLGDLSMLDLHPLPGIDPEIVYPPELGGKPVFDLGVAVDSRPPMGWVVAALLLRQIAYHAEYEISCDDVSFWIFETLTGQPLSPRARTPPWLDPELEARFLAFEPEAVLEFCERAYWYFGECLQQEFDG
jgi:hypothetical protein